MDPLKQVRASNAWLLPIALCSVIGGLAGTLYHYSFPSVYRSTMVVRIEAKRPIIMCDWGKNRFETDFPVIRHDHIIVKPKTISRCIRDIGIGNLPTIQKHSPDQWQRIVAKQLRCEVDREDPCIYILSFQSTNPAEPRLFINRLFETYRKLLDRKPTNFPTSEDSDDEVKLLLESENAPLRNDLAFRGLSGFRFAVLKNATFPEPVGLGLIGNSLLGATTGCALGLLIVLFKRNSTLASNLGAQIASERLNEIERNSAIR